MSAVSFIPNIEIQLHKSSKNSIVSLDVNTAAICSDNSASKQKVYKSKVYARGDFHLLFINDKSTDLSSIYPL